jgi:hypothetical protein
MRRCCTFGGNVEVLCTGTAIIYGLAMAAAVLLTVLAVKKRMTDGKENAALGAVWSDYKIAVVCIAWVVGIRIATMLIAHAAFGSGDVIESMPAMWSRSTDAHHYMDIAAKGYVPYGESSLYIVFFPLYPLLLGGMGALTGEYFYTGSLMSMVFLTIACFFFFKTVRREYGEKPAARALKYLMLFPSVFFAMMPMSEGLFLALAAMFFYWLRKGKRWAPALVGMLAALTRSVGVLLAVPFLMEQAVRCYDNRKNGGFWKPFIKSASPVLIIPLGTLIYLGINYVVQGDPFYFMGVQKSHWNQGFGTFGSTVKYVMEYLVGSDATAAGILWMPHMVSFTFGIGMIIAAAVRRRQSPAFLVYTVTMFYFSMSVTWLLSAMRYSLALLPCFMELGDMCKKRYQDAAVTVLLGASLICYTLAFASGGPVY